MTIGVSSKESKISIDFATDRGGSRAMANLTGEST